MERVERIEDLDVRGFYTQGIVSVGVFIPTCTASFPAAACRLIATAGFRAAADSFCRSSHMFGRLLLEALEKAYATGQLQFFGDLEPLRDPSAFARYLTPLKDTDWVVYAKAPLGGPQHVLEYLGRYTHRVAISNRRLLALEDGQVSFQWKDYRDQQQQKVMTVSAEEFIRRFLQHALPPGFQRIRYYGFLANCHRTEKLELCRRLLATACSDLLPQPAACRDWLAKLITRNLGLCPQCGVGILLRMQLFPCHSPVPLRLDTS